MPRKKKRISKTVETITHEEATRKNIPDEQGCEGWQGGSYYTGTGTGKSVP